MTGPATAAEVKALRAGLDPASEERRRRRQERGMNDATVREAGTPAAAQTPAPSPDAATETPGPCCEVCTCRLQERGTTTPAAQEAGPEEAEAKSCRTRDCGGILERHPDREAVLRCPRCQVLHDLTGNVLPPEAEALRAELEAFASEAAMIEAEIDDERAAPQFTGDDAAYLAGLAQLDPVAYDHVRKSAAKKLGIRASTLDAEVERRRPRPAAEEEALPPWARDEAPWVEPVNGADLAREIGGVITRLVVLPEGGDVAATLWVLHAWSFAAWEVSPLLAFTSPEPRCGKTCALLVLQKLAPRPMTAASITAAALFRAVERWRPTLLIDEADSFLTRPAGDADEALRGVLNSGHHRGSAWVLRCEGDDHEPKAFSTWAPKVVALIGSLPPTLADRAIIVHMTRKRPGERVEALRVDASVPFSTLRRKAARWAADNIGVLRHVEPEVLVGLNDRAADNWRPLLAVAEALGAAWAAEARQAAVLLSGDAASEDESARVQLLADIRDLFRERGVDRLSSSEIVETLTEMEERPWAEWKRGKPLSAPQLARLLRAFTIQPKTLRTRAGTAKGYVLTAFEDAFGRYLPTPPSQSVTPSQGSPDAGFRDSQGVTDNDYVTARNSRKAAPGAGCDGVTVWRGGIWEGEGFAEEQEEEVQL